MSNDTQPEIRFPGFTEDWEQRKLGDLGSVAMNKRIFKDQTSDNGEVPFFKIGTFGSYPDAFISRELFEEYKSKYPYPEVGDILISASGSIGRTVVYQGEDEYFQDSNIVWLKHNGRLDNKFLQQFYSIVKWQGLEGSTIKRLYNKNILDTNISVPTLDEQNKLGAFFEQLDDTIALHQRKLDLLKETKKGFLQKMFPKNGAKVPEIRFPGFTEDWEQRKVGDFLNESRIKGSDGSVARKMTVKLWRKGVVPKEEIYSGSSATQYYIRKSGQFMYGKLDFLNQAFGIVPSELDGYESTLDSPAFDIGENMNSIFLLEYVSLTRFYKYQGNLANGSRRAKRIHVDTFLEMPIPTPSFEEQTKIGGFFKQLDDTITLHQRKLDLLKETKKGFLQKMFV
ncbi:hypothetical protein OGA_04075 [Enterococcus faecium EnGen0012]|uniref:restriction endonuclease subunit S n=1 Tax=Enterococcus faecium TaxID=1352 RepID=UPI0002A29C9B|nr:restriction endonuclease subunit S [Enterococcus faecium]ELA52565.1 hypothetical protein OGA_04075 [Enterococcus faecium EnGen0012]ELA92064.1 hypothetical protein OI7_03872 [Enterococcus faecium EnGen0020]VFA62117.1 Type I restriction-modification system, specificity subunit S [Enterococcus faecium]HAZ4707690.1 restriction endonuclease subunit S [Enterococcus faecium]